MLKEFIGEKELADESRLGSKEQPFEDTVVKVFRCSKVMKGGRRFSFAALVVVGDHDGRVGIGYGKANEVPPAVEKGVQEMMTDGVVAGYPVVDVQVTLYDGSYHSVDSSDMAFKIAGSMCFKKCVMAANPILLEPIYDIEVTVPADYMGDVMGDLSSRRGRIQGTEAQGPFQIIRAQVPLAELYKYSTSLRSMTSGRGIHRRKFSGYEEVPKDIAEKVIAEAHKEKEDKK